jgi:hypothetical protein
MNIIYIVQLSVAFNHSKTDHLKSVPIFRCRLNTGLVERKWWTVGKPNLKKIGDQVVHLFKCPKFRSQLYFEVE